MQIHSLCDVMQTIIESRLNQICGSVDVGLDDKEVLLVLERGGDTSDCEAMLAMLRLKRLLAKRFESKQAKLRLKQSGAGDGSAASEAQLLTRILVTVRVRGFALGFRRPGTALVLFWCLWRRVV